MKTNLTYKEFLSWYKRRVKDNAWTFRTFLMCYEVRRKMKKTLPWKRKRKWQALCWENNMAQAIDMTTPKRSRRKIS